MQVAVLSNQSPACLRLSSKKREIPAEIFFLENFCFFCNTQLELLFFFLSKSN